MLNPEDYQRDYHPTFQPIVVPPPAMKDREYNLLTTNRGGYTFEAEFDKCISKGWIPFPESLNTNHSIHGDCYSILLWREKK